MASAMLQMPEKKQKYCQYTTVKIDADLVSIARSAAAKCKQRMQDWLSDLVNTYGSPIIGSDPIERKPPAPSKRNPRKSSCE